MEYSKLGLFKKTFKTTTKKYLKNSKLKFILTDTTNKNNKQSTEINKRNPYYKNKKILKISTLTNELGIPINVSIYDGNKHDTKCLNEDIDSLGRFIV